MMDSDKDAREFLVISVVGVHSGAVVLSLRLRGGEHWHHYDNIHLAVGSTMTIRDGQEHPLDEGHHVFYDYSVVPRGPLDKPIQDHGVP